MLEQAQDRFRVEPEGLRGADARRERRREDVGADRHVDGIVAGKEGIELLFDRLQVGIIHVLGEHGLDPERIASWGESEVTRALGDAGIVRHRGKIEATIGNARAWLEIEADGGFNRFLWQFVDFKPQQNAWRSMAEVPAETPLSKEMSKALKAAGFRFCGPTIVYAFSQAVGIFNDHLVGCPQYEECAAEATRVAF